MSRGLQQTKRRISSVTSTKKITGAMELVATAKLKVSKDRMLESKRYTDEILDLVRSVFLSINDENLVWKKENEVQGRLYIIVTSSMGLCAGYNYNVFRLADSLLQKDDEVIILGSKGAYHYRDLKERLKEDYLEEGASMDYATARKLGDHCIRSFLGGKYRSVELIYTHYVNSLTFMPSRLQLLPIALSGGSKALAKEMIMEPSPKEIIDRLIPLYLKSVLYGKIVESSVSEHASRRTAMENASDNAEEILSELLLEYNKARQAAITQEITEVVGGANSQ